MINDEIISTIARFFEGGLGPSHDELGRLFRRFGLADADPARPGEPLGKMKRVREVLSSALDEDVNAGDELARSLLLVMKAAGCFRPNAENYAGEGTIRAAREAFRSVGYELDPEGNLRPQTLENLDGAQLTEALLVYVRRARVGSADAALVVGTGKDLLEATARHALVESTGRYPEGNNFPTTLFQAFDRLGLATPPPDLIQRLDSDPVRGLEQCLWLLGCTVNRLRNAEGTGHGRPFLPRVTDRQAAVAIQAMGLVSQLLLETLRPT